MNLRPKFLRLLAFLVGSLMTMSLSASDYTLSQECRSQLDEIFTDQSNSETIKRFLKLQANLTTHRLAWTFTHNSNQTESFKLENEILEIINQIENNDDPAFIAAREQFRSHKLSRKALAEIMPFVSEILQQQASDINNNNQRFFHLKASDLKMLELLGSKELDSQGNIDSRLFVDNTQDQSILNLTKIVNSSLREVQTDEQIETFQNSINRYLQNFDQLFKSLSEFDYQACYGDFKNKTCRESEDEFNQLLINHVMDLLNATEQIEDTTKFEALRYGSVWLNLNPESSGTRNQRVNLETPRSPEVTIDQVPPVLPSQDPDSTELVPGTRLRVNSDSDEPINLEDFPALLEEYINMIMGYYNHFFTREYLRENPELAFQLARALERREASISAGEEPDNIFYYPNEDGTYRELRLPDIDPNSRLMERVGRRESVPYQQILDELNTLNEDSSREKRWPCGFRSPGNEDLQVDSYEGDLRRARDNALRGYRDAIRDSYRLRANTRSLNRTRRLTGRPPLPRMIYYNGTFCDTHTGFRVNNTVESFIEVSTPISEDSPSEVIVSSEEVPTRPSESDALSIYQGLLERPDQAGQFDGLDNSDGLRPLTFVRDNEVISITGNTYSVSEGKTPNQVQAEIEGRPYFFNEEDRLVLTSDPDQEITDEQILSVIQERNPGFNQEISPESYPELAVQADAIARGTLVYNTPEGVRFTSSGNLVENCDELSGEEDREIRRGCNSYATRMQEEFLNNAGDNERVIHQFQSSTENECGFYTIANKQTGYLNVYNNAGELVYTSRALYGETAGDQRTQRLNGFEESGPIRTNGTTGAGAYSIVVQRGDDDYEHPYYQDMYDGQILEVRASSGSPFREGGNISSTMAIHAPPNIGSRQERVDALAEPNPEEAQIRMSGGCINISDDNYLALQELLSQNAGSGEFECPLYVLPEDQNTRFELRNGELFYAPSETLTTSEGGICDDLSQASSNGCSTQYFFTPPQERSIAGSEDQSFTPTPIEIQIEDSLFESLDKPRSRAMTDVEDVRDEMRYYANIFADSLEDNKALIMNTLNSDASPSNDISDAEYNDLARIALAIMRVETNFCTDLSPEVIFESSFGENALGSPSVGCTQIKNPSDYIEDSGIEYDISNRNFSPERRLSGAPNRNKTQDGVRDSAVATVLYLHQALNRADNIGVRNLIRRDEHGQMTNYEEVLYHIYQGRSSVAFNDANTSASSTEQVRRMRSVLNSINLRRR
ncbi:MAG: hypothetical protein CME65_07600 [Halobacteriovoraceae bacterium]|nr:hypothetical protein [Halobacteriovoraceae bacterium]